mgnify:FL=1
MKRILFLMLLGALSNASLLAQQQPFQGELYLGAGGGGVAARMDFVPSVPQTLYYAYQGGIAAKYISEKHLGLVAEINLTRKGWTEEFDPGSDFSYTRELTYIDVPFLWHIYFGNKTRFIMNLGPQISYLIGENSDMSPALAEHVESLKEQDPDAPIGVQYSPMSEMRRVDYGLTGGAGIELKTGIGIFNLEGRYYFGLGDIFNNRRGDNAYFSRSAHRVISAKLTYYIQMW